MISSEIVRSRLGNLGEMDGATVLREWVKELESRTERCLEFTIESIHLFDIWYVVVGMLECSY